MCELYVKTKNQFRSGLFICILFHHQMFRVKKFLSLTALMIGGLIVASLPVYFSVAQNFDSLIGDLLKSGVLSFIMPEHDVYLYAVTEPNKYTIHFDGNEGYWDMSGLEMTYDEWKNLPANSFIRDWFIFNWWNTESGWTWTWFADESWVLNLTTQDSGQVTLFAQRVWAIPYTVNYILEDLDWWDEFGGSETLYNTGGTQVCISTWKIFTWFTLLTGECFDINPDWTSTVVYNYTRNKYNLTVKDGENTLLETEIKYEADIMSILPADPESTTWKTFDVWEGIPEWGKMPAEDVLITSKWIYEVYTITFDPDGWTDVDPITGNYGDPIIPPENPTKEWYEFVGWDPELTGNFWENITVKAIWKEIEDQWWGWWWSGWWWRGWWWGSDEPSDEPTWDGEHGAAIDAAETIERNRGNMEVLIAYMWARSKWIIDTSRKNSDPDGYIPRWDMAELVVKFTENVLGRTIPPIPSYCKWWDPDIDWLRPDTKMYAEKSCALWVMWIRMQNFLPNKILDRAEFWTILSRLLWWPKYDVVDATATKLYYTRHLDALSREWIMTQIDNPEDRWELRKWAWLMLMRVKT